MVLVVENKNSKYVWELLEKKKVKSYSMGIIKLSKNKEKVRINSFGKWKLI